MFTKKITTARRTVTFAIGTLLAIQAGAQGVDPQTGYPQSQPAYPQPAYPQQPYPQPGFPQTGSLQYNQTQTGKRPNPLRQMFAGTLNAVLMGADSTGLVGTLVQGVSGGLTDWFQYRKERKAQKAFDKAQQQGVAGAYPTNGTDPYATASAYPSAGTYPSNGAYPATGGTPASAPYDPNAAYPNQAGNPAYPATSYLTSNAASYDWSNTQVYDPRTGQASSAQTGYALASPPGDATAIVAGGAYDVYAQRADGSEVPVNAATYDFRTGDRFKVYFRPSLPGRLEVYNINPNGRETRIDAAETAAGQLTTLGPYEFTATRGNEALRFVLSPCSSQQLMVATRDIVNVSGNSGGGYPAGAYPAASSTGLSLGSCSTVATRSVDRVKTRDIVRVGVDGNTSFALDPVSQSELASGQLTPREFTVYFRHN